MNALDPFVAGLVAGVALGFTGTLRTLVLVVAFAVIAYVAWVVLEQGVEGVQVAVDTMVYYLAPHARLATGAALGALFGDAVQRRIPALRRESNNS